MLPLFSTKALLKKKQTQTQPNKQHAEIDDFQHEFFISEKYKDFEARLTEIEHNKSYHFVSFGQWSLKHIVFHILKLTGPASVYSTTYGLGPTSARGIVSGLKNGMISLFNFLYDWKIKTYKEEAHNLCAANFPVKITSIHAKVTVILNEQFGVVITGSANWSDKNDKIETITITTNRQLAEFHKTWIVATMNSKHTEPKNIIKEISLK